MSYMEKLLEGVEVEWKTLGDYAAYEQPTKYLVKSTNYNDEYSIPVLTAGKTFILGYTDETNGIFRASKRPVIIFDDFTTANKWVDFDFKAKSSAMKIISSKDENKVLTRYIYHWLNTLQSELVAGDHRRQWISNYSQKSFPLPPLEIQQKIVGILDAFTELTAELKIELEAELTARQKQYEYYREQLLSFGKDQAQWEKLGDIIINSYSGSTPRAGDPNYYENGTIPWLRTQEVKFTDIEDTEIKITEFAVENTAVKWIPANCVIIAISGATAGRSAINKISLTTNQHCLCLEINPEKALYRYVFHWVSSNYEKLKNLGRGARGDLNSSIVKNFKIPIPTLREQERIVSILDKFDTLTHSISEGLPREIELRQKQYEYYRGKLLSFATTDEHATTDEYG